MIALLGNLARDVFPGQPPRPGGAPFHAARALRWLGIAATIYARCAPADRDELLPALAGPGIDVHYVPGRVTASFGIDERGSSRRMHVLAASDPWPAHELPDLPGEASWVHVAPLLRSDFPAASLAALARGRRLSLDGQGLVRRAHLGALELDADYDPELLRPVWVLKLSDDEAEVLGDPAGLGVPELLVTHGAAGATVYLDGVDEEVSAPAIGGNHTGTGDAFSVAYLAGRAAGAEPVEAARQAALAISGMLAAGQ